jgi:hypothetical protein
MKLTINDIRSSIKTKSEESSIIAGMWLARSVIGIFSNKSALPVFGFSGEFDRIKCETSSIYELIEHIVFLPSAHSKKSANSFVKYVSEDLKLMLSEEKVEKFLIGSWGPTGRFYANGTGIFSDIKGAVTHSKRELLERHLCCEIWYHRTRPLSKETNFLVNTESPHVKIDLYTTDTNNDDKFALAALECTETGFFVLGAAVRSNEKDAFEHATAEAVMFFEDAKKGRQGLSSTEQSRQKVLSLRERITSQKRKSYFQYLTANQPIYSPCIMPLIQTIMFEPFSGIYAARSFSKDALYPRQFDATNKIPLMPLF